MAQHRFVVKKGNHNQVGSSLNWCYSANENELLFYNNKLPDRVIKVEGDFIGEEVCFLCAGELSKFVCKVQQPKDPRAYILWKHGFTRMSRVTPLEMEECDGNWLLVIDKRCGYEFGSKFGINSEGKFTLSKNIKQQVVYNVAAGKVTVATAHGPSLGPAGFIHISYLDKDATLEDVQAWEKAWLEVINEEAN